MKRQCPVCGNNIIGRSDKKFCSAGCKNKFHHPSKNVKGDHIKMVNRFLFQNYKIIESLFKDEKKDKLMLPRIIFDKLGFHYNYCTGCYINNKGKLYRYIYSFSWMEFSNQQIMITRNSNI